MRFAQHGVILDYSFMQHGMKDSPWGGEKLGK
jgi:hypothetical protein